MEHLILGLYILFGMGIIITILMVIVIIKSSEHDNDRMIDILTTIETEEDEWKRPS